MAEMLLQSHAGMIELLPALPKSWAVNGAFTGLRACGNVTVDCVWKDGKVTQYRLASPVPHRVTVRVNGETKTIMPEKVEPTTAFPSRTSQSN